MGKGKRLKQSRAIEQVVRTRRISPGQLAVDEDALVEQLLHMAPEALPFYGLAAHYLASSPVRDANQCLLASTVLMLAMRNYGIEANLVALELDFDWADGGRGVHYGRPDPQMIGTEVRGHVGLLTKEWFLDATASQFREVRNNGGVRPVGGRIGAAQAATLARQGGQIQLNLSTGNPVRYTVYPVGSADGIGSTFIGMQPDERALPVAVMNALTGFSAMVALAQPGVQTPYPKLNADIRAAVGKTVVNRGGVLELSDDVKGAIH